MNRTRLELSEEILKAMQYEALRPYALQSRVQTNHRITKEILAALEAQGLVTTNSPEYAITNEGHALLTKLNELRRIFDWRNGA